MKKEWNEMFVCVGGGTTDEGYLDITANEGWFESEVVGP